MNDDYTQLSIPEGTSLEPCPCCASEPELWQYSEVDGASKVVMCSNGTAFGPQSGIADEGCPLYMPSQGFYRATIREAVRYWNEYAKALVKQQRDNRWKKAQVLRQDKQQESQP